MKLEPETEKNTCIRVVESGDNYNSNAADVAKRCVDETKTNHGNRIEEHLGFEGNAKLEPKPEKNPRSPKLIQMLPMLPRDVMMSLRPNATINQKPGKQRKKKVKLEDLGEVGVKLEREKKVRRIAKAKRRQHDCQVGET